MNLSEMYATLTANKPELACGLTWVDANGPIEDASSMDAHWEHEDQSYQGDTPHSQATALIRVRWEDSLPMFHFLYHYNSEYRVVEIDTDDDPSPTWYTSAIEALYHFHMEHA